MTLTHIDLDRIEGLPGRLCAAGALVKRIEMKGAAAPIADARALSRAEQAIHEAASDLTALITRIRELEGAGWQDISTAPKDGTRILVVDRDNVVRVTQWGVMYTCTFSEPPDYVPRVTGAPEGWVNIVPFGAPETTHWRPLPSPPALQRKTS